MTRRIPGVFLLAGIAVLAALGFAGAAQAVTVQFTGPEEMVFDWTTQQCDGEDIPDGVAQAFRDSTGRLQLVTPNAITRRMVGTNFNNLTRDCHVLFSSNLDPNPAHFDDASWLRGLYTENGTDFYALVHEEYHRWQHPGACPSNQARRCGSGAVTFAVSHDNGDTYTRPVPPDNFIAAVPTRPTADLPRQGLFSPSAPVKKGNYYYSLMFTPGGNEVDSGVCVMRTTDLSDPGSWRGWDGTSFSMRFRNPYYESLVPEKVHACQVAAPDEILQMQRSVTFNTALNKFVVVGNSVKYDPNLGQNVYGFYFSTSDDLVHWSPRQLLMQATSLVTHMCGGPDPLLYPSLIDHDSTDRNFRVTDDTMYLYYVRIHFDSACQFGNDRDLLRIPVRMSP